MYRTVKFIAIVLFAFLFTGMLLVGLPFLSYVRTSAASVREAVKNSVPIEFELQRAKDMVDAILPELQTQVRMIAQEEVEIAALEADVNQSNERLDREQVQLTKLRNEMRTQLVSFEVGGREWSRSQMTEQLARRLDRYKSGQLALAGKERLLDKRKESLTAALSALDSMRHRKAELEHKVEALAAQARILNASQHEAGIHIDGSELSQADQLVREIETRLDVAKRVLDHEQDIFAIDLERDEISEEQVLADFDDYFDSSETPKRMVTTTAP